MPQVDLETLVSAGSSDRKITCETLAVGDLRRDLPEKDELPPPDFPPESFWLSKDAELDWLDRNAFLERKESAKGICGSANLNLNPGSTTNSQRFAMNLMSTASIIGLPKTQKTSYLDVKRRNNKPANINLFPKGSQPVGKSAVSVVEPSSPKVSCMGRVRSKRGRRRSTERSKRKEKSIEGTRSIRDKQRKGFCSRVISLFKPGRSSKAGRTEIEKTEESPAEELQKKSITVRIREFPVSVEPITEPPGLGGMNKFTSSRRSGSSSNSDHVVATGYSLGNDGPRKES